MLKKQRFSTREKSEEKKSRRGIKNNRATMQKTQCQRPLSTATRGKSFLVRSSDKRGKNYRLSERVDASSTESTNLSEREKKNNLVALRKEIDEWKRQELLRSRVNEVLAKAGEKINEKGK